MICNTGLQVAVYTKDVLSEKVLVHISKNLKPTVLKHNFLVDSSA